MNSLRKLIFTALAAFAGLFLFVFGAQAAADPSFSSGADSFSIWAGATADANASLSWDNGTRICAASPTDNGSTTISCLSGYIAPYRTYRVQINLKNNDTSSTLAMDASTDFLDHKNTRGPSNWAGQNPALGLCGLYDPDSDDTSATCRATWNNDDVRITREAGTINIGNNAVGGTDSEGFMYLITMSATTTDSITSYLDAYIDTIYEDSSRLSLSAEPIFRSLSNQYFSVGQATTSISPIRINSPADGMIRASTDIRIAISSSTAAMMWDTSDEIASISGNAEKKVGLKVSYEGQYILVINVTEDFVAGDYITISGLSFADFSAINLPASALDLYLGGTYDASPDYGDASSISIGSSILLGEHSLGSIGNMWRDATSSVANVHYRYSLVPAGESMMVSDTVFNLGSINGISTGDISDVGFYIDYAGNGVIDDTAVASLMKRIGGTATDAGYAITSDTAGNIYLSGSISGNADLNSDGDTSDPGETTAAPYGGTDIFLSKWSQSGTHLWSERIGGTSTDYGYALTVDQDGNIYLGGSIFGNADLNGDGDTADSDETTAIPYGWDDIFLSKWSSSGTHLWSRRIGGASWEYGFSLVNDEIGDVYLTGFVNGTADLNSDGDVMDQDEVVSTPYGDKDIFLSKWSTDGAHLWSKRIGGTSDDRGNSLAGDQDGNIYLTGYISGNVDLNNDGDTSDDEEVATAPYFNQDILLSKWSASGTNLWSIRMGAGATDLSNALIYDNGNVYISGYVNGTADFNSDGDTVDTDETVAAPYGSSDIFLSKWSASGSHFWSMRIGGASVDKGQALASDQNGNIYLSGYVKDTADLNSDGDTSDPEETIAAPYGNEDIFLSKWSPSGTHLWSGRIGGMSSDYGNALTSDRANNIYLTGSVSYMADLNSDSDTEDVAEFPASIYNGSDAILLRFHDPDLFLATGTVSISGDTGTISLVPIASSSLTADFSYNLALELTASDIADGDRLDISLASTMATGTISNLSIIPTGSMATSRHARGASTIQSASDQVFQVGQASTAISTIRITDIAGAYVLAANDIYISIATSSFGYSWDTSDTVASISGTASSKASTNVTFINDSLLKIEISSDFATNEYIEISGLSYADFITVNSQNNLAINLHLNGGYNPQADAQDQSDVSIKGSITAEDQPIGQVTNAWSAGQSSTTTIHYRYSLVPTGENIIIGTTTLNLSSISGITSSDITSIRIYTDYASDGQVDQIPSFLSAQRIGGASYDYGQALAYDPAGNIYLTGYVYGTADLNSDGDTADPGETTAAPYGSNDIFLSKWSSTGTHLWSKRIGGIGNDYGYALAYDSEGNIYLSGTVNGTVDFNSDGDTTDTGETTTAPYGNEDVLLSKWSSSGTHIWTERIGGSSAMNESGKALVCDQVGNIYLTGYVYGTVDLNSDGDTADSGETIARNIFFSKWSATGTHLWSKRIGGTISDSGNALSYDPAGNIYLSGHVYGTVDLNGDNDTADTGETTAAPYGNRDIFLSKWSATGTHLWSKRIGGASGDSGYALTSSPSGDIYLTGNVYGTADFNSDGDTSDPGETTAAPYGSNDIFLSKWSATGTHLWSERIGGTGSDHGYALAYDPAGNIYLTGYVEGTADLNSNGTTTESGETTAAPYGSYDIFLSKWSATGTHLWSGRIGGASSDFGYALAYDPAGNIYLTGHINGTADLSGNGDLLGPEESAAYPYASGDAVLLRFGTDTQIATATATISGTSGSITFATSTSYQVFAGTSTGFLMELTASDLAAGDQMQLSFASAEANGYITGLPISPSISIAPAFHYVASGTSAYIFSANDQTFGVGQATTSISAIRITSPSSGIITATDDIYIAIATSTFDYRWDTTDTQASISGTAAAKADTAVTYPSDSVLKIDITSNLNADEYIIVSGLSYHSFASATSSQSGALQLYLSGAYTGLASATDLALVGISGSVTVGEHSVGASGNMWRDATSSITNVHYRYSLVPAGEAISVSDTFFNLSSINGISTGDISDVRFYLDYAGNGVIDDTYVASLMKRIGGTSTDYIYDVICDQEGNVYLTGGLDNNFDLNGDGDTDDEEETTTPPYGMGDIFLSKWSAAGVHLWSERLGGTSGESGRGLAFGPDGSIYMVGIFYNTADLNGDGDTDDAGETTNAFYGSGEILLSRWSPDGTNLWSKRIGSTVVEVANAIAADDEGNVYITGYVYGNSDLNADGDIGDPDEIVNPPYGTWDIYLSKWSATGTNIWYERIGGTDIDEGLALAYDHTGNIYLGGLVRGTADFNSDGDTSDPGETTTANYGWEDVFLSKWSAAGAHLWSKRIGGTGWDNGRTLAVDQAGDVYLSGYINDTVDFNSDGDTGDPEESVAAPYGGQDAFLAKWSATGTHLWSERIGGASTDIGYSLSVDKLGYINLLGSVSNPADLNSDGDTVDAGETSGGVFFSKWNADGIHLRSERLGNAGSDFAYDPVGNIYVVGTTNTTKDLNGDGDTLDPAEYQDVIYGQADVVFLRFHDPDLFLATGTVSISGDSGTISLVPIASSSLAANFTHNLALELTASDIADGDRLDISLASTMATGTISNLSIIHTGSIATTRHARGASTIQSASDQVFQIGQASTAISTIRITDIAGAYVLAANDIYISIATSSFGYSWDTSDTVASISGTASSKASTNVTFINDSLLKIEISSDFATNEYIDISGLSYANFITVNPQNNLALSLHLNGGYNPQADAQDQSNVSIKGNIIAQDQPIGQVTNAWSAGQSATTTIHYRYSLVPTGENVIIGTTTLNLSSISGITGSDISNVRIYADYASDGQVDLTPGFLFARRIGGAEYFEYGQAIAFDQSGDIYLSGYVQYDADFNSDQDVGDSDETLASPYGNNDIFLSKWSATGTHLWSERIGGASVDEGYAIASDLTGNIYLTGRVNGTADLNSDGDTADTGETTAAPYGGIDIFLSKWSATGTHLWSERIGGAGSDYGYALACDPAGNIFLTGYVNGTADFNSDGDTADTGETTASPYGNDDILLSKWSAAGAHLWSERIGGASSDKGYALASDSSGNVYMTGSVYRTADFNSDGDTGDTGETYAAPYNSDDIILSKWSAAGAHLWSERIGGTNSEYGNALAYDPAGYIYLSGYANGTADMDSDGNTTDPDETTAAPYSGIDILLSKWSVAGSHQWSRRIGGTGSDYGRALAYDQAGGVYLVGDVYGTADFNSDGDTTDSGEVYADPFRYNDIILSRWNGAGTHLSTRRIGGASNDYGYAVASSPNGGICLTGSIRDGVDFNGDGDIADQEEAVVYPYGQRNVFLLSLATDRQIATGSVSISGATGTISFATSTSYALYDGSSAGFLAEFTAANLASGDAMSISFADASSTGKFSGLSIAPSSIASPAEHMSGLSSIYSAANQSFVSGQATSSVSAIRVISTYAGLISKSRDFAIAIATGTFDYRFDTSDDLMSVAGTAAGKVDPHVTFVNDSTIKVHVYEDFLSDEYILISGLSYAQFGLATTSQSGALRFYSSGKAEGVPDAVDSRTVAISGSVAIGEHSMGSTGNMWRDATSSVTNVHYRYSLVPAGESISVSDTIFNLGSINGISTGDISDVRFYLDYAGNGVIDDTAVASLMKRLGGTSYDTAFAVACDQEDNIYISGYVRYDADFNNDGDFDDHDEATISPYGGYDAFISKWSAMGTHLWSERIGGAFSEYGNAIAYDQVGNIYLTGQIYGTTDLNSDGDTSDPGETAGAPYGNDDIFLSKWSTAGTHLWSKRIGGASSDYGYAVAADKSGYVYLTGTIYRTVDFNSDGDTADSGETYAAPYNGDDAFLSKWSADGTHLWSERIGGLNYDSGRALAFLGDGNIYLSGFINGTADFNSDGDTADTGETTAAPYGIDDVFLSKWSSAGVHVWSERIGGASGDSGYALAGDQAGNIYLSGRIFGTADLNSDGDTGDTGEVTATPYGSWDIFLSKWSTAGAHLWSKRIGGSSDDSGYAVATNPSGDVYLTGYAYGDFDLNNDGDTTDINEEGVSASDNYDLFLSKWSSSGAHLWSERMGGDGNYDDGYALAYGYANDIFLVGKVEGIADLNGDGDLFDSGELSHYEFSEDIILLRFHDPDLFLATGTVSISGDTGTISLVPIASTSLAANFTHNLALELKALDIADGDTMDISLASTMATGTISNLSIIPTGSIATTRHARGASTIQSASDQVFQIGQASTAISTIRITDIAGAYVLAANDIYISIATSSFGYSWDTSDTVASISGTAASKADTDVTFINDSLLKIEISSDFNTNEYIDISGLSYANFTTVNPQNNLALSLHLSGGYNPQADAEDQSDVSIKGNIIAQDQPIGQVTNAWSAGQSSTTSIHYRYSLVPTGENMIIGTTTLNLSSISGITDSDITSIRIYTDYQSDGQIDHIPTFLSAQRIGGAGYDIGYALATDQAGNIYLTGRVDGTADLNGDGDTTDPGETTAAPYGGYDIFLSKWSATGTHLWFERIGGTSNDYGYALTTDQEGNIYLTGYINGTVDLNSDGDTADTGETTAAPYGSIDILLSKWSATGTHLWSERIGGASNDYGRALVYDPAGNIYLTGYVNGTADLNSDGDTADTGETNAAPYGNSDIFLSKWSSTGTHLWSERIGGASWDYGNALAYDPVGNIYLTGSVSGTADFSSDGDTADTGETTAAPYGNDDIFLSKWSATGTHLWSERIGGASSDYGKALAYDPAGNIYLTGYVNGTADLNSDGDTADTGETTAAPYGSYDIFLSKWSTAGIHLWSSRMGGTDGDYSNALLSDQTGNIYLTGEVYGAVDLSGNGDLLDPEELVDYPYDNSDIILLRFGNDTQIATASVSISGTSGSITFATSSSYYLIAGTSTGFLMELTAANLQDGDQLSISGPSLSGDGTLSGLSITQSGSPSIASHFIATASTAFLSLSDQYFQIGQATTTISPIRIASLSAGSITSANDLYIAIATSTFDYRWDTTDTTASISGTAAAKADTAVTYPSDSVLKIDITSNLNADEYIIISGLSYHSFASATSSQSGALQLYLSGAYTGLASATDMALVGIAGYAYVGEFSQGKAGNMWRDATSSVSAIHYRYSLAPEGEAISIGDTVFGLSHVNGVSADDVSEARLYVDYTGNGIVDEAAVATIARRIGGPGYDYGNAIAYDQAGSLYLVGTINRDADLNGDGDLADQEESSVSPYDGADIFLSKWSIDGTHLWSKRIGGEGDDYGYALAYDRSGYVYITGSVYESADFNSDGDTGDTGENAGAPYGYDDIFLSKWSADGSHVWSERIGGSGSTGDVGRAISCDQNGSIYLSGHVKGTADLSSDGDTGDADETPTATYGNDDIFLSKWSTAGSHLWSVRIGGTSIDDGYALANDPSGDVYLSGLIFGTADFNSDGDKVDTGEVTGAPYGTLDILLSKWSAAGSHLWSERIGGADGEIGYALACDQDGNAYLSGNIVGTVDLNSDGDTADAEETSAPPYGYDDAFLSKWSGAGSHLWSVRIGGASQDYGYALAYGQDGDIYLSGFVNGTADMDSDGDTDGPGETPSAWHSGWDILLSKWSLGGEHVWSKRIGGISNDNGQSLAYDQSGSIILFGNSDGASDLDGDGTISDNVEFPGPDNLGPDAVFIRYYDPDLLLADGSVSISGGAGTASFSPASGGSLAAGLSHDLILELAVSGIADGDTMDISLASARATGTVTGLGISLASDGATSRHARNAYSIGSLSSQSFQVGQASTSISTIRISDIAGGYVLASYDIYVSIATSSFGYSWDTGDTLASISGTASAKASSNVTFINDSLLKIDVLADFSAGEYIDVSGLSYAGFDRVNAPAGSALNLHLGGGYHRDADAQDQSDVGISGVLSIQDMPMGQAGNAWDSGLAATTSVHYRYSLVSAGEGAIAGTTTLDLIDLSGVSAPDISSVRIFIDYGNDGEIGGAPAFMSAQRLGGMNSDSGEALASDRFGNTFLAGYIDGAADLDGDGDMADTGETPSSPYGDRDIFLSKWNSAGVLAWSRRIGGEGGDEGKSVASDQEGNVYLAGYIGDVADLNADGDTSDEEETAGGSPYGDQDLFISKWSANGTHLWSRRIGGEAADYGESLAYDQDGYIYLAGFIEGTVDLNSDGDTADSDETDLSSKPKSDIFLSKWSETGTHIWSERIGGADADYGYALAYDQNGNIYLTGSVNGSADFNSDGDTDDADEEYAYPYDYDDMFLSKWSSAGAHLWSVRIGGEGGDYGYALANDQSGNVFLAGSVYENADLNSDDDIADAEETIAFPYGGDDAILSKWSAAGSHLWSARIGSDNYEYGYALACDQEGRVYLGGSIYGLADLNSDGDTADMDEEAGAANDGDDIFISQWSGSGGHLWSERIGGADADYPNALSYAANGNIYLAGIANGSADFRGDGDYLDTDETAAFPYLGYDIILLRFANDTQIATGSVSVSGTTGSISFATSSGYGLISGTSTGFLVELTASDISAGDSMSISFAGASSSGAVSGLPIGPTGAPSNAIHSYSLLASLADHTLGQAANFWQGKLTAEGIHYRFRLQLANGDSVRLGTTTLDISGISGVTQADLSGAYLYFDTNSDGIPDAGMPSYPGTASISGANGSLVFPMPDRFLLATSTDMLVGLTASNLKQENRSFISIKGDFSAKGDVSMKTGSSGAPVNDSMTLDLAGIDGLSLSGNTTAAIFVVGD